MKKKQLRPCKFCFIKTINKDGFCCDRHRIAFSDLRLNSGNLSRVSIDAIATKIINSLDFINRVHSRFQVESVLNDVKYNTTMEDDIESAKIVSNEIRLLANSLKKSI